ncbi:MAG: hypothetical protein WC967_09430 [Balneolaceae bacterium]
MFQTKVVVKKVSKDTYTALSLNTMQCATGISEKDALKELELKLKNCSNFNTAPFFYHALYLFGVLTYNLFNIKSHSIWYETVDE